MQYLIIFKLLSEEAIVIFRISNLEFLKSRISQDLTPK